MRRELVELPGGDVEPLAAHLVDATFVNLRPTVDEDLVPAPSSVGSLFSARGPAVPFLTWTPTEVGFQHATGPRALDRLAEHGHPLPAGWRKLSDHPKRGAVLVPPPDSDPLEVIRWLIRAGELLCPIPVIGPWNAVVHRR